MISITSDPIDFCKILENVMDVSSGATALFLGTVRDHNEAKEVSLLYYEAYKEMAEKNLAEIENEAKSKWNINKFVAIHRTGDLKVGEISVLVAASAPHRNHAFEACMYGIDQIKIKAPIWKKEVYKNGADWLGGIYLKRD